jgi:hypothetical protein
MSGALHSEKCIEFQNLHSQIRGPVTAFPMPRRIFPAFFRAGARASAAA